ncbi:MAG TPA: enoyl-CoA hydratase-related protein [Pseudolysinimonas sp.]|jgi:enoyl-CoA hydratase/carnithine racemase
MSDILISEVDGAIATLTLNRPAERNAISDELREELRSELERVSRIPEVRVVILTGAGKSFCAGGDVKSMRERLAAQAGEIGLEGWRRQRRTGALASTLHSLDQITIAAVNGHAVGLGLDLALACDFIVAAPQAVFAASFVNRGLVPDGGGMYYLPRRIGLQKTKDLIFSGRTVDSDEAARIGLVDVIAEDGKLLEDAREYASRFTGQPRGAIMLMKSIVDRSFELSLESVAALGAEAQAIAYQTDDHRASVEAFLAPRPPAE